jgi:hypothetical protein
MNILNKLSIRSRLILVLVFTGLAIVSLGAFSSLTIKTETNEAANFIDGEFESVVALSEVRAAVGNARRYEKDGNQRTAILSSSVMFVLGLLLLLPVNILRGPRPRSSQMTGRQGIHDSRIAGQRLSTLSAMLSGRTR